MKCFIVFPSNSGPYRIEAERYLRTDACVQFWAKGALVKTVETASLLTIVEDKESTEELARQSQIKRSANHAIQREVDSRGTGFTASCLIPTTNGIPLPEV